MEGRSHIVPSDEALNQASTTHLFDGHIWNVPNVCVLGAPRNQKKKKPDSELGTLENDHKTTK